MAVLLVGCTPAEPPISEIPNTDTVESVAARPLQPDSISARPDTIPSGTAGHLSIASVFQEGAAGSRFVVLAFTDESESACIFKGYTAITPIDSSGASIPGINIVESENTYFPAARVWEEVRLSPGERASFQISFGAVDTEGETCVDAAGLAVRPPGSSDTLHVREPLYRICTGEVRITPVISGIPQF